MELTVSPTPAESSLSELASDLEQGRQAMQEVEANLEGDSTTAEVESSLQELVNQVAQDHPLVRLRLAQNPSTAELRDLEAQWRALGNPVAAWRKRLSQRATALDEVQSRLRGLETKWQNVRRLELPRELQEVGESLRERLLQARGKASQERDRLLVVTDRLSALDQEIRATQSSLVSAREALVKQVLVQDSPPVWALDLNDLEGERLLHRIGESLQMQGRDLLVYLSSASQGMLLHLLSFSLILLGLTWSGKRVRPWTVVEPALKRPAQIFQTPWTTSFLLVFLLTPWLYPQPPMILKALLGATALLPAAMVLRRLLDKSYLVTLKLTLGLFFLDGVRALLAPQLLLSRVLFTFEISVVLIFLAWRVRRQPQGERPTGRTAALRWLALGAYLVAWVALNSGFVNLGYLVGQAALNSTYLAILLRALLQVVDGVYLLCLRTPPLSLLASVRNYRPLYRQRLRWFSYTLAQTFWLIVTLDFVALWQPLLVGLGALVRFELQLGSLSLSLGGAIGFVLCCYLTYQLSRWIRFQLSEDVYPRLGLTLGQSYTVSLMVHYLLLFWGLFFGLAALGLDTTKFAIVAGALSVGIGLGLQNVVNHFISGLILLFERPIEVGHTIEVAGMVGSLQRIGLRASVLRTPDGSEIIVPNGELLSSRVTNWTLSDQRRMLKLDFGVAYGNDPARVCALLLQVAKEHADVLQEPGPEALLTDLGENALHLQLRAWTDCAARWASIRSELLMRAYQVLQEQGIQIPFPTRTIHLHTEGKPGPEGER